MNQLSPEATVGAVQEIVTDLVDLNVEEVSKRVNFLTPVIPSVTTALEQGFDDTRDLLFLTALLEGKDPNAYIRNAMLGGAFALGVAVGIELHKRGYILPTDTTLDET